MQKLLLLSLCLLINCFFLFAQSPVLGSYANTTIATVSGNTFVSPSAAPSNVVNVAAYTDPRFKGLLQVDAATGVVRITNAHPAGSYIITIKGFSSTPASSTATTFNLTVGNSLCSQGFFSNAPAITADNQYSVAIGDFNDDGKQDIVTSHMPSQVLMVRLGDGLGSFTTSATLPVGSNSRNIIVKDINNDGRQDIVVAVNGSQVISIYTGNGTGTFNAPLNVPFGNNLNGFTIADFNNDGKQDLAVINLRVVSIRLGDGAGSFTTAPDNFIDDNCYQVAAADFNGDGNTDLAITNFYNSNVLIRLGNGAGGFTAANDVFAGNSPHSITLADFNGDGKMDLATSSLYTSYVNVCMGNGNGSFSTNTQYAVGSNSSDLSTGDFNGDGKTDIAVARQVISSVAILSGNGAGSFTLTGTSVVGTNPEAIAIGDFNSDGRQDMAVATSGSNSISIRIGNPNDIVIQGNGTTIPDGSTVISTANATDFGSTGSTQRRVYTIQNPGLVNLDISSIRLSGTDTARFRIGGITTPTTVAAGSSVTFTIDFVPGSTGVKAATVNVNTNNCIKANYDFAIQGNGVAVPATIGTYANTTVTTAGRNTSITPSVAPANASFIGATTSTNFKGAIQVNATTGVVTVTNAHPAGVYLVTLRALNWAGAVTTTFTLTVNITNCGRGQFITGTPQPGGDIFSKVRVADFNNDGKQDLIIINGSANTAFIRLGNGAGGFAAAGNIGIATYTLDIVTADFNGDGNIDLAYTGNGVVSIKLGDGTGSFTGNTEISIGAGVESLATADFNGDGIADLLVGNTNLSKISLQLGDGTGHFTNGTDIPFSNYSHVIATGDFNGDGYVDFASPFSASSIAIRLGNGAGGFTAASDVAVQTDPRAITIGDFNNDGKQDLAVNNYSSKTVSIRLGNGAGGFTGTTNLTFGATPNISVLGDYNGDGKQDLAVICSYSEYVSVQLGNGAGNFSGATSTRTEGYPIYGAAGDFDGDGKQDLVVPTSSADNTTILLGTDRQITVRGNNRNIVNGAATADTSNFTQFDTTSVGLPASRTFTIQNTGGSPLAVSSIVLSGADTVAFRVSGISLPITVAANASATFSVTFSAADTGTRSAFINIATDDCDEPVFRFAIQATAFVRVPDISAYPNIAVVVGSSSVVLPQNIPVNTLALSATATGAGGTASLFKGILSANPITGEVRITNAYPAGQYLVKLKAFNGASVDTSQFLLTVNTGSVCGPALFGPGLQTSVGASPQKMAVGDFNEDGVQDVAVPNAGNSSVSIRLGNGSGGFTGTTSIAVNANPKTVVAGDFNGDGHQDFAVANNSNTGSVSIRLGNGSGSFTSATDIAVDSLPEPIAIGDFDNDGRPDLAIACQTTNSTVAIKLGAGNGIFTGTTKVPVGKYPKAIVTGDFNGDGNLDFATVSFSASGLVSVRLGNGAGNFTNAPDIVLAGSYPYSMTAGDFNGDGYADVAVTDFLYNRVYIRLGTLSGSFTSAANFATGAYPTLIALGDYNVDGKQDLLVVNSTDKTVSVMAGNGTGGFSKITDLAFASKMEGITTGDFNGDGRQDFVVSETDSSRITTRLNALNQIEIRGNNIAIAKGSNTPVAGNNTDFGNASSFVTHTYTIRNTGIVPLRIDSLQVQGAGASQFITGNFTWPASIAAGDSALFTIRFQPAGTGLQTARLYVYSNDCDDGVYDFAIQGTGVNTTVTVGGYNATTVVSGADTTISGASIANASFAVATASSGFKGMLQVNPATGVLSITNAYPAGTYTITVKGSNGFSSATSSFVLTVANPVCSSGLLTVSSVPISTTQSFVQTRELVTGDFNNDGYQDFASFVMGQVAIYLKNTAGTGFTLKSIFTAGSIRQTITVGDVNGDGNQDLVILADSGYIKLGDGTGNFYGNNRLPQYSGYAAVITDFNSDSKPDIITLNYGTAGITLYTGDGTGAFYQQAVLPAQANSRDMVVGDLNGDGNVDIVTSVEDYGSSISVYLGNGAGGFTNNGTILPMGSFAKKLVLADFNKDGKLDIAATNNVSPGAVLVRLGDGTGGFGAIVSSAISNGPNKIVSADFNGDGYLDIATSSTNLYWISVRMGDGTGSFSGGTTTTPPTSTSWVDIAVGDVNRDGRHDLITSASAPLAVAAVLYGTGNEINVQGNGTTIPSGDTIPSLARHTSFGSVVTGNSITRTFTIQNTGVSTALTVSSIRISGADSAMFTRGGITLPATIAAGASTTFTVIFTPQSSGLKTATVIIANNDCDEGLYSFAISGSTPAPGAALDFDGTNDYAEVNDPIVGNSGDSAITLSAYIKTSTTTASSLMSKKVDCTQGSYFDFGITTTGRLTFTLGDASGHLQSIIGRTAVNDSTWHQVTAVRSADTLRLYVDGNLDTGLVTNGVANINNAVPVMIGANRCNGASDFFKGQVDEVRLFTRALSTAEIQVKVSCELGGTQAGLQLYYKLNQGVAGDINAGLNTLQDASGQNRIATLQNFALTGGTSNWVAPGGVASGIVCTGRSIWLGLSPNWNDPANWSTGFVPLEMTRVEINTAVPNPPEITTPDAICYSLTLLNGATIIIRSTGHLTIVGP